MDTTEPLTPISSSAFRPPDIPGLHRGTRSLLPLKFLLLAVLIAVVAAAWRLHQGGAFESESILRLRDQHPAAAAAIFVLLYALCVVSALPTLPLNLAAGLLWGWLAGGVLAAAGACLGSTAAFVAARTLLGKPLARRFDSRFVNWLQSEFDQKSWRLVAFLRLNPIFPTGPLNYVLGLTSIRTATYTWATLLFLLPPSVLVAIIGHEMGTVVAKGEISGALRAVLVVSAAVTVLVAARYAARFLTHTHRSSS